MADLGRSTCSSERGLSLTQITLLDTPFFLLIVLAEVPTGAIADRFGRRSSLMLGSALFAVAVFIFGVADSYPSSCCRTRRGGWR